MVHVLGKDILGGKSVVIIVEVIFSVLTNHGVCLENSLGAP